jgi:hypothetical protein
MYYVYQHKKADTNSIFYIGKGKGKRAFTKCNRSQYWKNVVAKHGLKIEFVVKDVDEELAFLVEAECIDQNKKLGIKLINMTDGGEGTSGYKHTKTHREKMTGNKFGASTWGTSFKGKTHSDEQKAKWAEIRKGVTSPRKGVVLSDETKRKISQSRIGLIVKKRRVLSDEQIREIRALLPHHYIAEIARRYSVGESTIRRIRDGERYGEIT